MTQPGEPSSSSNTEHRLQKGFEHKIQQYPVSRKHEEHISLPLATPLLTLSGNSRAWQVSRKCWIVGRKYIKIIYVLDSAHEKFDVWIQSRILPFYPTEPVEFNGWVDLNQICRIQLIQTSNFSCTKSNDLIRRMKSSTFELGLKRKFGIRNSKELWK